MATPRLPKLSFVPICVLASVLTAGRTNAADWHVDAVSGNNANDGLSSATAWRTISYALATIPQAGQQRVLVAAGHYDEALGEVFPLRIRDQVQLLGAGPATTVIENDLPFTVGQYEIQAAVVIIRVPWETSVTNINPGTVVSGFRITTTRSPFSTPFPRGVWVQAYFGVCQPALRDLKIDSMFSGVFVEANHQFASVDAERIELRGNQTGLVVYDSGRFTGREIDFVDNAQGAASINGRSGFTVVNLSRSRVTGTGGNGIAASASSSPFGYHGDVTLQLSDCLLVQNQVFGTAAVGLQADAKAPLRAVIERCTIADNYVGIRENFGFTQLTLDACLLDNLQDDLALDCVPNATFNDIVDGDYAGSNGNFSAPTAFVAPATGDYRVWFGSPVIDAGNPATPVGTLDFAGVARAIDGDLDTVERGDVGCHEFRTLAIDTTGVQGTLLQLEMFGPSGGSTVMTLARGAAGVPVATPFGEFDLSAVAHFQWFTFPTATGPGTPFTRPIPTTPIFIGQTYSFQGRVTSSASPSGAAWSNAVGFTIVP